MFRDMRRTKQALTAEECIAILKRGTSGVLALSGDENYPYAVPMSYHYHDSAIYFHAAPQGHKIDALLRNPKVSFCVIDQDQIVPQEFTTYFRSVILFGKARLLEDREEKVEALKKLALHYSPGEEAACLREIESSLPYAAVIELQIEHMSGKEATELVKQRNGKA